MMCLLFNPNKSMFLFCCQKTTWVEQSLVIVCWFQYRNGKRKSNYPQAVVTEILGVPGTHETEIHTIMASHGLPGIFQKK